MSNLFNFIMRYPRIIISGTIFFTLLFLWNIPDLKFDPSLESMIPSDHPTIVTLDKLDELFGGTEIVIVGVEGDSILWEKSLIKYAALHDSLENLDQLESIISLYNAPHIASSADGFVVEDVLEIYPATVEEFMALQDKIRDNELVYLNIVSADFTGMAFMCRVESSFGYDENKLRADVERVVDRFRGDDKIYISGLPITRSVMIEFMQGDMKTFMPYGIALMIILLALSFRSWLGVFLPLSVVIISIVWTFGLMALINYQLPFIGVLVPVMLIAIANDYGIHIIAHYYEYVHADPTGPKLEMIKKTIKRLSGPILLAGITTVIGFLSLLGHVLPKIREFGLFLSYGITMAFFFSIFLISAALSVARQPRFLEKAGSMERMNKFLHGWGAFFIRFRQPFILIMIAVMLIIGIGIESVVVDANPDKYFRPNSHLRKNNDAITRLFGGSTQLLVLINGDIKDPETLGKIDQLATHLKKHPLVSNVFSVVDQIKSMNSAFHEGSEEYEVIPDDRNLIAQYLFLYGMTGNADDIERFMDDIDEPQHALMIARLKEINTSKVVEMTEDTEQYIKVNFGDELPMEISGPVSLISSLAKMIVRGQIISLTVSVVIIFILMSFVFRSLVGGFLAIIPLSSSIILVFGLMGYLGIELNLATAMLSSIMIGVGVDYTVHFLWHLRDHIREGEDLQSAIFTTLRISGKGIIFNALSVVIGFTVLTLSAFMPVYFFGFLIVLSISMCLFGALAILPALISWMNPKFLYK
ncbi:MAG: MMPL family transporter [Candidatus Neomarinimicrobiota bacterium]